MDAGWLEKYDDQYNNYVENIFKSIIQNLTSKHEYTYTVGDIGFFKKYYEKTP